MPGYHAVLSMLAFGLEENAHYDTAERVGRRSVELEPRDGWGWHAVAHVMEMQNRRADGIAWLTRDTDAWSDGSFFAIHNWWHLALFHLGLDDIDEVLSLVDERVLRSESPVVLEMIDASAMLWRLQLRGISVGHRWHSLAERWLAASAESTYAFNDMHAMMSFVGAGRDGRRVPPAAGAQRDALAADGDNRSFLREVGIPATESIHDFAQRQFAQVIEKLRSRATGRQSVRRKPRAARPDRPHADRGRQSRVGDELAGGRSAPRAGVRQALIRSTDVLEERDNDYHPSRRNRSPFDCATGCCSNTSNKARAAAETLRAAARDHRLPGARTSRCCRSCGATGT